MRVTMVKSYGGLATFPPGFSDWEHPKLERTITSVRNGLANRRIRLNFSVLFPFQRFIPISAFYSHFSVLSPFQRFIPILVSAFSFRFRVSVSAFYPYPAHWGNSNNVSRHRI
jgi:hypothetical protein